MLKQIGKYTISERIGRGTYSRVYRAIDAQGRSVAIKVSTTQTQPGHLDEFQKDLVQAASVLHPNLVAVHDLGFEDEFPYLVMELVEGHDLDKLLKGNAAPSLAERIRVMQQAGSALKAAHERGVFHLDVRPSKIMLADSGEAKLLGLGLGRLSFDPARVTEHGYLVGAPFYMSPERLTAIDTANERCDIWSFGVTSYEWISGHHPFYDDDGDRMIGNIMDAVPADLLQVPAQLNHTILRAIEKDPHDRYHSFAELLADLQPLVSDLKREESDALMAEALKQSDSGRWHEARRIARQMRDLDPKQGPGSQIFGIGEQELEKERTVERVGLAAAQPLAEAIAAAASVAAASAAASTPEPAPILPPQPLPAPTVTQRAQTATPPPQPFAGNVPASSGQPLGQTSGQPPVQQRPERTAPKIPPMGVRNGPAVSSAVENRSPATARALQQSSPAPSNGARAAATVAAASSVSAAAARPAAARGVDTAAKTEPVRPEPTRTRPPATPRRSTPAPQPAPAPQQTVRILEMDEPSRFPWARILGFAIPLLLIAGALFFVLSPGGRLTKASSSSEEAKEVTRAGRVIKGDDSASSSSPSESGPVTEITPPATTGGTLPVQAGGTPVPPDQANPANPEAPKAFDPKTLAPAKGPVPLRRRGNAPLNGIAPPPLTGNSEGTETAGLPMMAMNTPPPPAPAPVVPPPTPAPTPAAATVPAKSTPPAVQSVEAARESANHVGGSFQPPVLIHQVSPIYPPAAFQRKATGTVRFQATVAKDGSLKNVQLLSGDPLLNVAARQAVLQWKYRPAMLNGDPIEVTQGIVVNFTLSNR